MKKAIIPLALLVGSPLCLVAYGQYWGKRCGGNFVSVNCPPYICYAQGGRCDLPEGALNTTTVSKNFQIIGHCYDGTQTCSEGFPQSCKNFYGLPEGEGCLSYCFDFSYAAGCPDPH